MTTTLIGKEEGRISSSVMPDEIYGVKFSIPEISPEGFPGLPTFYFKSTHCSTSQIFGGTIRGIIYDGKKWFGMHNYPGFLIQLPKGTIPVQSKFFNAISQLSIS